MCAFVSVDWFDNDPSLASALTSGRMDDNHLPYAVAVRGRVGQHDEQLYGGRKADPRHWRPRILSRDKVGDAEAVKEFVHDALRKAAVPTKPAPEVEMWSPGPGDAQGKDEV